MSRSQSKAALQLDESLKALQRISNLEFLRPYVIKEQCFLQHMNPEKSPITTDELKRLARAWKMDHEQRNFWKNHPDEDSLVQALMNHIDERGKILNKQKRDGSSSDMNSTSRKSRDMRDSDRIDNLFGKKDLFREKDPQEIILRSRASPSMIHDNTSRPVTMSRILDDWRNEELSNSHSYNRKYTELLENTTLRQ